MKNKVHIFICIQLLLILILIWLVVNLGRDEFNNIQEPGAKIEKKSSLVEMERGINIVTLSNDVQKNSGIKTVIIKKVSGIKNLTSYANVLNIDLLIEQKNKFNEIKNQINIFSNEFDRDQKNFDRLKLLNDDNKNISDKALYESKTQFENTRIKLENTQALISGIKQNIRAQWGETILAMIDQNLNKDLLNLLILNQARLIKVTLIESSSHDEIIGPPKEINVALIDNLNEYFIAKYLSEAPTLDKTLKGKTYFYIVYNGQLRIDSKIIANLIQNTTQINQMNFLSIPKDAVVWNSGLAWIYIKTSDNKFVRKVIDTNNESADGWVISDSQIKENDQIVINGAQLILSEEFKYQIKNENDD